jgi:hypothetical protein
MGHFAQGIASFDQALDYQPNSYPASLYRIVCLVLTGRIMIHLFHSDTRGKLFHHLGTILNFLKYRLLILVSVIALLSYGQGDWINALKELLPTFLSLGIVLFIMIDLWKHKSRFSMVWQTYFRSGILTYIRALGMLLATLGTFIIANQYAPPFLQWGWAELVFGQPGNVIFQPFNQLLNLTLHPYNMDNMVFAAIASIPLVGLLPILNGLAIVLTSNPISVHHRDMAF